MMPRRMESAERSRLRASLTAGREPTGSESLPTTSESIGGERHPDVPAFTLDLDWSELFASDTPPDSACLGCGSFSEVFRTTLRGEAVAVKILTAPKKGSDRAAVQAAFLRELTILGQIAKKGGSPFLLRLVGACTPRLALVTELAEMSLHELLHPNGEPEASTSSSAGSWTPVGVAKRPNSALIDENRAEQIAEDVARGLLYLHDTAHAVHLDLKPGNVLLKSGGAAMLGDFGIGHVRVTQSRTSLAHAGGGSPPYQAPEQWAAGQGGSAAARRIGAPADVWAFGCLLCEMGTGRPPWHGIAGLAIGLAVAAGKAPQLPAAAGPNGRPRLRRAAAACFVADPAKRPTIAAILHLLRSAVPAAVPTAACSACSIDGEERPIADGWRCGDVFLCGSAVEPSGCLEAHVLTQIAAVERTGRLGCICGTSTADCPGLYPRDVASRVGPTAYEALLTSREAHRTRLALEQQRREHELAIGEERAKTRAAEARADALGTDDAEFDAAAKAAAAVVARDVEERTLTTRCPAGHAFLDYDGCMALECATCGVWFCGYCLGEPDAHRGGPTVHRHVITCPERPAAASGVYARIDDFHAHHRARAEARLRSRLAGVESPTVRRLVALRLRPQLRGRLGGDIRLGRELETLADGPAPARPVGGRRATEAAAAAQAAAVAQAAEAAARREAQLAADLAAAGERPAEPPGGGGGGGGGGYFFGGGGGGGGGGGFFPGPATRSGAPDMRFTANRAFYGRPTGAGSRGGGRR